MVTDGVFNCSVWMPPFSAISLETGKGEGRWAVHRGPFECPFLFLLPMPGRGAHFVGSFKVERHLGGGDCPYVARGCQ